MSKRTVVMICLSATLLLGGIAYWQLPSFIVAWQMKSAQNDCGQQHFSDNSPVAIARKEPGRPWPAATESAAFFQGTSMTVAYRLRISALFLAASGTGALSLIAPATLAALGNPTVAAESPAAVPPVPDLALSAPSEKEAQGWQKLLQNDPAGALTVFQQAGTSLSVLEGVYQCQRMLGDDAAVWRTQEAQAEAGLATPAGRFFFQRLQNEASWTGRGASFRALTERLYATPGNPDALCAVAVLRNEHARNQLDAKGMTDSAARAGYIPLYARLVGPFCFENTQARNELPVLPPQLQPDASTYEPFNGRPVRTLEDFRPAGSRWLTILDLLPRAPRAGVYFAQVAMRSAREQSVVLSSDGFDTVWLNGWPVYEPELFRQKQDDPRLITLRLKKGVNTLLFLQNDHYIAQVQLQDAQGGPAQVEYLPFQAADWKDAACRSSAGWKFSTIAEPLPLTTLRQYAGKNPESVVAALWLAEALEQSGRYEDAEAVWRALHTAHQQSALICDGYGHFLRRYADEGNASRTRLHKQAGELFTLALAQRPEDLNAILGLALLNTAAAEDHDKTGQAAAHPAPVASAAPVVPAAPAKLVVPATPVGAHGRPAASGKRPAEVSGAADNRHQVTDPAGKERRISVSMNQQAAAHRIAGRDEPLFRIGSGYYKTNDGEVPQEAYLRQAAALREKAPGSLALLRLLIASYLDKTWSAPARELISAYAKLAPEDRAGLAELLREAGELAGRDKLLDELAGSESYHDWLSRLIDTGRYPETRQLLEKFRAAEPRDLGTYYENLVRIELAAGNHAAAATALAALANSDPVNPHLAVRQGDLALQMGNSAAAIAFLAHAQELNTAADHFDPALQERLRTLNKEAGPLASADVALDPAVCNKVKKEDHPRANYATMIRLRAVRLYPGGAAETFDHHAVKVLDKSGIESLSELPLPHGRVIACRTVQPDGSVFIPDSAENIAFGKAMSMYNVRPGSTLDYSFRQSDDATGGSFEDAFEFEDFDTPVVFARYTLTLPKEMLDRADISTTPEDFEPEISEKGGLVTLVWETHDLAGRESEENLPPDEPVLTGIQISIASPKPDSGDALSTLVPALAPRQHPALTAFAAGLTTGCNTQKQKALRIFDWVAAEIAEQSGSDGGGSATPYDTFLLRTGSTSDKTELCRALLAAAGLNTCLTDTNTSFNRAGYLSSSSRAALAESFNSCDLLKVFLPEEPEDLWLNFHNRQRYFRSGDLGSDLPGALARDRTPMGITLSFLRPAVCEYRTRRTPDVIDLSDNGSAVIRSAVTYYGSSAASVRSALENPHDAQEFLNDFATGSYPRLTDPVFQTPSPEQLADRSAPTQPVVIRFQGKIDSFCSRSDGQLSFPAFGTDSPHTPATPLPRENPFYIGEDTVFSETRIYTAPEGWTFVNLPRDIYLACDFGTAVLDCNVNGRQLCLTRYLLIPTQQLEPEQCEAYNHFVSEIQRMDETTLSLQPIPAGLPRTAIADPGRTLPEDRLPLKTFTLPENLTEFLEKHDTTQPEKQEKSTGKHEKTTKPAQPQKQPAEASEE